MSARGRLVCINWNLPTWHADEAFNLSWHNWHTCSTFSVILTNTHDGSLPVCSTSTQPRGCEIAKTLINIMKNVVKRHVRYTILNIDLPWTTNTIFVDDICALCLTHCAGLIFHVFRKSYWRTCVSRLDGGRNNIFWPFKVALLSAVFLCSDSPDPTCPAFWQA